MASASNGWRRPAISTSVDTSSVEETHELGRRLGSALKAGDVVGLEGRRLLAADDWVRQRDDPPVLARLDAAIKRAAGRPDDLDGVAAARGPGSFTGLRVGLSLAAGLAYARHVPLHLIDSLPILARRAAGDPAGFAVRDAGRGEVYAWREGEAARGMPAAG